MIGGCGGRAGGGLDEAHFPHDFSRSERNDLVGSILIAEGYFDVHRSPGDEIDLLFLGGFKKDRFPGRIAALL